MNQKKDPPKDAIRANIRKEEWGELLGEIRTARALLLKDSEAFHQSAMVLEHIGQVLIGKVKNGLSEYTDALLEMAKNAGGDTASTSRLIDVVREARNMAVHEGAWARHLSSRLIELLLILESAIMQRAEIKYAEDIMVRSPIVAEPWHMLAQVRRSMLENSFTHLPVFHGEKWYFISDTALMQYLHKATSKTDRNNRLSATAKDAVSNNLIDAKPAHTIPCNTPITVVVGKISDLPLLITTETGAPNQLVGIITPFDLL